MHQVFTGSGGNNIELALLSTGINGEYINGSITVKRRTKAMNTTSNSWNVPPRKHAANTYLSDDMHRVVAGSCGNIIELALLSTMICGEYINVSVTVKHRTKAFNTCTSNPWEILPCTYTT